MGRKLAFDETLALDKAMLLFWRQGYQDTSLQDLLKEMGILNGSFYHLFKDKKQLFLQAMEHYRTTIGQRRMHAFGQGNSFSESMRLFFSEIVQTAYNPAWSGGCLILNSINQACFKDPQIAQKVREAVSGMESFFAEQLQMAIEKGEAPQELDPHLTGQLLMTFLMGVMRKTSMRVNPDQLRKEIANFLICIGI